MRPKNYKQKYNQKSINKLYQRKCGENNMASKKEQILNLFYNYHFKEVQIAEHLAVSQPYVSKVITANELYIEEMKNRHDATKAKRPDYQKEYQKTYKRPKKEDIEYEKMKVQHIIDVKGDSFGSNLSDEDYWKCNRSAFNYNDKKERFELNRKIKTSNDVPKHISTNEKLRPQKYKKPCFMEK